jgi:phage terminase large subunit
MPALEIRTTKVFEKNTCAWDSGKTLIINCGGTSSSKTYSILQLLILIARSVKEPTLISIVSESVPHNKRGVQRDVRNIMGETWSEGQWNRTDSIYDNGLGN